MSAQTQKHDVFQAIADPTRRSMLVLLQDQELAVSVITKQFPISRTAVSKHLRVLADAGLVKERKVGRETRYRLEPEPLLELKQWYERFWENKLSVLKHFVETDLDSEMDPESKNGMYTRLQIVDPIDPNK